MLIYAPNHLRTYAPQTELSEFVLPKESLNNCADRIEVDFETEVLVIALRRHRTRIR